MSLLFIFNESPTKVERAWHGLRVATTIALTGSPSMRVFLFGDAVELVATEIMDALFPSQSFAAKLINSGIPIGVCGSCLDARSIAIPPDSPNLRRASLTDAAAWIGEADAHLVY